MMVEGSSPAAIPVSYPLVPELFCIYLVPASLSNCLPQGNNGKDKAVIPVLNSNVTLKS
jgi:hypothetical protein